MAGSGDLARALPSLRTVGGDGRRLQSVDIHAHPMSPEFEKVTAGCPARAGEGEFRFQTIGPEPVEFQLVAGSEPPSTWAITRPTA